MALQVYAYPGAVEIPRWDSVSITEGSGLGIADRATVTGSDPGWRRRLMGEFDEVVFRDRTETFGPFDIVAVDRAGEAKSWIAECVQNYYWEQALADMDPEVEEAVLAVFRSAISANRGSPPFAGWSDDDIALVESFLGPSLEGATGWDELVTAAEQWGLTAHTEKSPGTAPTVAVIPRYPVAGGPTGRMLEMPWPNLDVTSVQIRLVDRANPVGGWVDRRIVSTDRSFIRASDVTTLVSGSRTPSHYLDLQERGLAQINADLARWRMQNECLELTARWPLRPDDLLDALQPHDIVAIPELADESAAWRVVSVTGDWHGDLRTAIVNAFAWQGFFLTSGVGEIPTPTPARTLRVPDLVVFSRAGRQLRIRIQTDRNVAAYLLEYRTVGETRWQIGGRRQPATTAGTIMLVTLPSPGRYELRVTATAPGYASSESIITTSVA